MTEFPPPIAFTALMAAAEPRPDGFAVDIPDSWLQGRTAYGGLSSALAFEAARQLGARVSEGGLAPLRSASVNFVGPLAGPVEVRANVLRVGRNAAWIGAEIRRNGEVGLVATFVFMRPVESVVDYSGAAAPGWAIPLDEAVVVPRRRDAPQFSHAFDRRFGLARSETLEPDVCWWVRLRDRAGIDPMTELVLLADCLPPGIGMLFDRRIPISSMVWQMNLLTPAPATRDGWWLLRSTAEQARQGCSSQLMGLWASDLAPTVTGMQSVALFA